MKTQIILLSLLLVGCKTSAPHTAMLTADQARLVARQLANENARALYGCQPFSNGAPARFDQGRWIWSDRRACGAGDMEAAVILADDGSARSVDVTLLHPAKDLW